MDGGRRGGAEAEQTPSTALRHPASTCRKAKLGSVRLEVEGWREGRGYGGKGRGMGGRGA